jgi:hypothetical protein
MPHLDRTNEFIKEVIGSNQRILIHWYHVLPPHYCPG